MCFAQGGYAKINIDVEKLFVAETGLSGLHLAPVLYCQCSLHVRFAHSLSHDLSLVFMFGIYLLKTVLLT